MGRRGFQLSTRPPVRPRSSDAGSLARYDRRFGGVGTIVTLDDGRAFTAAHCLAAVDGRPGVVISSGARHWRVVRRWSPATTDLALLQELDGVGTRAVSDEVLAPHTGTRSTLPAGAGATPLATASIVHPGVQVRLVGHTCRRFQSRAATVVSATATAAVAVVTHKAGVRANDSGGPVFVDGVLVGIVTSRTGLGLSSLCSSHVVFTRLDSKAMRARIAKACARLR